MEQQQNQAAPNRRQRRAYLKQQGIIKALAKMPYFGEVRSKVRSENMFCLFNNSADDNTEDMYEIVPY